MSAVKPDSPIVVVGAGCFGLSTAYHLLNRGFTNVTVLDRAETLPAKDAASTDLNKSRTKSPMPVASDTYPLCSRAIIIPGRILYLPRSRCYKSVEGRERMGNHYHEFATLCPLFFP
jgi:flavin-dependent dehydrogenase